MRNLFIFLITFFCFLPAVAETALKCQAYKQCTTIDDLGCTNLNDQEDILVVINDEIEFLTINHDVFFDGKYIIQNKEDNQYSGYGKINLLSRDDLESWKDAIEKAKNNEITEEEAKDIIYLAVFQGRLDVFYLDRYLLTLKLKLIDYFPSYTNEKLVVDYNCEKVEKVL